VKVARDGAYRMKDLYKEHIQITENIKKQIEPLKVVFPSYYGRLYSEAARELHIDLKPDELLDSEMLNEKVVHHVITLSSCAEQAIAAMESEDKKTLLAVLAETKALRDEIHELQQIVYEDALTKCYNRKWFEDFCLNSDKRTMRGEGTLAIVDLNKFKEINDTFGHVVGDRVLIHVSKKLQESGGKVVRYGGDEFIVVFNANETPSKIQEKIESMLHNCNKTSFKVDNKSFKVSFAFGITPFKKGYDLNAIVDAADKAMYRHKRSLH